MTSENTFCTTICETDFRDRGWGDGIFSDVLKRQNMSDFYFASIPLVNTAHNRFDDDLFVK